jgi:pre-rRNA-processing protein TSR4
MADEDWGEAAGGEWGAGATASAASNADVEALVSRHEREGPRIGVADKPARADAPRAPTAAEREAAALAAAAPPEVLLGFVEEPEAPQYLQAYYFPSKVGGKPAWIDPLHLPSAAELACPECGDPLAFLAQVYASLEVPEEAFHRTVFVFVCRRGGCLRAGAHGSIRAIRAQLPRENPYFSFHPPQDAEARAAEGKVPTEGAKQCAVCGLLGSSRCGRCHQTAYCCRSHQQLDWTRHKLGCSATDAAAGAPEADGAAAPAGPVGPARAWTFPEFELVIDTEPDVERALAKADLSYEERLLQKYRVDAAAEAAARPAGAAALASELAAMEVVADDSDDDEFGDGADIEAQQDEAFHEFQRRTSVEPEQCVRYCRHASAAPLWISADGQPKAVPACGACGAARQFEFQVMPQLLNHLDIDALDASSIDWGILAVYTCSESCSARPAVAVGEGAGAAAAAVGTAYLDEFVWRQMPNEKGALL